ncbi:MAG: MFS transporter [Dehalococcoidia bacterium]
MNDRQPRLFYGWIIVGALAAMSGLSMALAGFNFGLFIRPMERDLGISRQTFGWALSVRQIAGAVTAPFVGRLLDKHGARGFLIAAVSVSAAGMIGLAYMTEAWQLLAIFIVMGLFGMVGPGAMAMSVPVAKWFVTKRGKAMAIVSIGTPVGAVIFVPLTELFIHTWGWQNAWLILAGLGLAGVVPLALLIRRQPEDMGLLPDGATARTHGGLHAALAAERSFTVSEATHTVTFWRLVTVFSLVMLAMGSVGLHRIPHFSDQGISAGLVSLATSSDAVAATASTFAMGMLFQRFPARYVGSAGFVLLSGAVVLTIYSHTVPMMFLSMIVFGFGAGGMILLQNFLWADYFGRANVGGIRGAAMPFTMVFSAAGPPLSGYVQDSTGSYNPVWWVGSVLMVIGAAILVTTPPPGKRREAAGREAEAPSAAVPAAGG